MEVPDPSIAAAALAQLGMTTWDGASRTDGMYGVNDSDGPHTAPEPLVTDSQSDIMDGTGVGGGLRNKSKDTGIASTKQYAKSRPKYGVTQVDDVWNAHADKQHDTVIDPSGAIIKWDRTKPRSGQWDMGHKLGQKYSTMRDRLMRGEIDLMEFLMWYRNPDNYRPELPQTNRSHKFENNNRF